MLSINAFNVVIDSHSRNYLFLQEKGIIENYVWIYCYTSDTLYWWLALYFYLAILQVSALVLAFKTRHVEIKVLNDSKETYAIVYITSVIVAELLIVTIALSEYNNIFTCFYYGGILIAATVILSLVYVPKVRL